MRDDVVRPNDRGADAGATLDRRTLLRGAVGVAGAAGLATSRLGTLRARARQATPAAGEMIPSGVEGVPDAYLTMPAPAASYDGVPGSGGTVRTFSISYNPPPPGRDENQFWQELERRLGVTWQPDLTPQPSFGEKSAALIAGGDLPDLYNLNPGQNAAQQYQAMAQGAFLDLTPYVTGDAVQAYPNLAAFPAYIWENVKFQGKILGVPKPLWRNGNLAFYRGDWAQTVGIEAPTDPQQVHDLLVGFSTGDPDGNGNQDTWGTGRFGGGWDGWDNRLVFPMFGTPNNWRLNDDGTLTHMIETEEYRQGLEFLRQLYADGGFHPDSAGMTFTDAQNNFVSGKTGLHTEGFLSFFGIGNVTYRMQELNPAAQTVGLIPPGPNAAIINETGFFGSVAIPASVGQDEERVAELLRILDYLASPFGSEEYNFLNYGLEGVHHEIQPSGARVINDRGRAEKSDLVGFMGGQAVYYYPEDPPLAERIQQIALQALPLGVDDPTLVLYSESNISEGAQLSQLGLDRTTAIITGREAMESFDAAVEEWRSRGGDRIREEYQQALQEQ